MISFGEFIDGADVSSAFVGVQMLKQVIALVVAREGAHEFQGIVETEFWEVGDVEKTKKGLVAIVYVFENGLTGGYDAHIVVRLDEITPLALTSFIDSCKDVV